MVEGRGGYDRREPSRVVRRGGGMDDPILVEPFAAVRFGTLQFLDCVHDLLSGVEAIDIERLSIFESRRPLYLWYDQVAMPNGDTR